MAHFIGKLNLLALIGVRVADVELDGREQKVLMIPIKENDIVQWGDELQLWFRAFGYRSPKSRFTHFLMRFVPLKQIRRMSAGQIEAFANRKIGGLIKCNFEDENGSLSQEETTEDFIQDNL